VLLKNSKINLPISIIRQYLSFEIIPVKKKKLKLKIIKYTLTFEKPLIL
jgi:hypothetical protein